MAMSIHAWQYACFGSMTVDAFIALDGAPLKHWAAVAWHAHAPW